jgi:hypothetical protein
MDLKGIGKLFLHADGRDSGLGHPIAQKPGGTFSGLL